MRYGFKVYYHDGTKRLLKMGTKLKLVKMKNRVEALKKFKVKFSGYAPVAAF